jgi:hypothetical protein
MDVKGIPRGIVFFALSLVAGEVVRRLLTSRLGASAAERLGRPELATYEGASAASKEVKSAVGFVRTLTESKPVAPLALTGPRSAGWVGVARDASEMLLAAGALLKTVSDFASEDAKLRSRLARTKDRG